MRGRSHPDSEISLPLIRTRPTCTSQSCTFYVEIVPLIFIYRMRLDDRVLEFLASALGHLGLRPWAVSVRFEVRDAQLWESRITTAQARRQTVGSHRGIRLLYYEIIYTSSAGTSFLSRPEFAVGVPHVTGSTADNLRTYFAQTTPSKANLAFDVDLRCYTALMRSCRGFDELAPAAWADYQSRLKDVSGAKSR
jgi:hypothetical protein